MIRVLHVIPSLEIGGAERLVSELLPILKEEGIEVSLFVNNKFVVILQLYITNSWRVGDSIPRMVFMLISEVQ